MTLSQKYQSKTLLLGPCSAESCEQMQAVYQHMYETGTPVSYIRAGVWKPRSRPGSFEGRGAEALEWIIALQAEYDIPAIVEVANTEQLELIRKHDIRAMWIGARTAADPFRVQHIADALAGDTMQVYIKNPVHPDLPLWMGNIERVQKKNKGKTGAIHRGFSVYDSNEKYRNRPYWTIPLELKRLMPELDVLCDPSHISGDSDMVASLGQKAWNMNFDGLMVEVHPTPREALSDAKQQIDLAQLDRCLADWEVYTQPTDTRDLDASLEHLRQNLDTIDAELIELLATRSKVCEDIGLLKRDMRIPAYIPERWNYVLKSRSQLGEQNGLKSETLKAIYQQIHQMSISAQNKHLKK